MRQANPILELKTEKFYKKQVSPTYERLTSLNSSLHEKAIKLETGKSYMREARPTTVQER